MTSRAPLDADGSPTQRNESALLLPLGLIDLFDAFWLGMALLQGAVNAGTLPTLMGACVLTVLNFVSGLHLVKVRDTPSQKKQLKLSESCRRVLQLPCEVDASH